MPLWGIEKKRQPNNDWYPRLVQNRNSNDSVCRHCFQHCCLMIAIKTIDITIILMMLVFFQVVRMCNNRNGNSNKDHSSTTMMLIYIYIHTPILFCLCITVSCIESKTPCPVNLLKYVVFGSMKWGFELILGSTGSWFFHGNWASIFSHSQRHTLHTQ